MLVHPYFSSCYRRLAKMAELSAALTTFSAFLVLQIQVSDRDAAGDHFPCFPCAASRCLDGGPVGDVLTILIETVAAISLAYDRSLGWYLLQSTSACSSFLVLF